MIGASMEPSANDTLRHAVATLAYRAAKAFRGVPESFGTFRSGPGTRTPREILAHLCDLMDWGVALSDGRQDWNDSAPAPTWEAGQTRFFAAIAQFDAALIRTNTRDQRLFRGPISDALTHIGQISMLRRMAGYPVRGENYFVANIRNGQVGREQSPSVIEFD